MMIGALALPAGVAQVQPGAAGTILPQAGGVQAPGGAGGGMDMQALMPLLMQMLQGKPQGPGIAPPPPIAQPQPQAPGGTGSNQIIQQLMTGLR